MAPLEVIGAGWPRNGTKSLKTALNILGYKTHHLSDLYGTDYHPEAFVDAYKNPEKAVDWDALYAGFNAALDTPTVFLLPALLKKYPDAKVILVTRDADSWYSSLVNTMDLFNKQFEGEIPDSVRPYYLMMKTLWPEGPVDNPEKFKNEPETVKARYKAHNDWVLANVPAERLLVLELESINWEKLCAFLGKPIPSEPYPHANTTQMKNEHIAKRLELRGIKVDEACLKKAGVVPASSKLFFWRWIIQ